MPAKTTVHLLFGTHDKHLAVKRKLRLDGRFRDDIAKIDVPLMPGFSTVHDTAKLPKKFMVVKQDDQGRYVKDEKGQPVLEEKDAVNLFLENVKWIPGGKTQSEVWIDAEQGVQVKYNGLKGWVGVPGRFTYASQVQKDARDLQTRGIDFSKFVWPVIIFILGVMAALVGALAFSVQRG